MNELSKLEKAKREISLLEHAITFVSIAGQAHQRMYHTDEIPANYLAAIDLLNNQLSTAKTRLKQIETLEAEDEIKYCPTCGEEWSGTSCGADSCGWITG